MKKHLGKAQTATYIGRELLILIANGRSPENEMRLVRAKGTNSNSG